MTALHEVSDVRGAALHLVANPAHPIETQQALVLALLLVADACHSLREAFIAAS